MLKKIGGTMSLLDDILAKREESREDYIDREIKFITLYLGQPDSRNAHTILGEVGDYFKTMGFRVESDDRGCTIWPERG